jgi:DNA ligase-1
MKLEEIVRASNQVTAASGRLEKVHHLAGLLRRARSDELPIAVAYLSGELPQGRIGIGPATLRDARPAAAAESPQLELAEVHATFDHIAGASGSGAGRRRGRLLNELIARATAEERDFLSRLVMGELRQGAQQGIMLEAIARAAEVPASTVRRAVMFQGDLGEVASVALTEGRTGLERLTLQLFRPVKPMLAQTADDPDAALAGLGEAALEHKLDGARVQVHRSGDEVKVYTRSLNDVTMAVPEIVDAVRALPTRELVLDGEALAFRPDGTPHPFQVTMRRFGRRLDVDRMRDELPLSGFFFDCLYLDGASLIDHRTGERLSALSDAVGPELQVKRTITADPEEARAFLRAALDAGHEGMMAKALDAPYAAGRRGGSWLKVKPAHTLDLVVLAAEWGSGRRRGWLSNLHLGARDPEGGGFIMLGKTFKGLSDEMLEWQTKRFLELEVDRDRYTVYLEPALVVEIAFNDIQESPRYPGGLALRFARVKRYRPDKTVEEADTIQAVRAIHSSSTI